MPRKVKDPKTNASALFTGVVDGLKKLYRAKIRPLEATYLFGDFHSPLLTDADFENKPTVLLLGQYSTGKTSFIRYLLERDFPGQHIGPEPTTDRFMALYYGTDERVVPGNALAVQADKPFRGLERFGTGFLNKFAGSQVAVPLLEHITLIDTPGVLSGEKQRLQRGYDFPEVVEWFAERADMILLLFDAHKLDISDEFKRTIMVLKGHDDKVRVVLNKADSVSSQQLMRVYGALMWSLGKVFQTPEVVRVYLGSFWDQPLKNTDNAQLFEDEMRDLLLDLHSLPKNSAMRKVNELVKRSRMAKTHALIISHMREQLPMFGKEKAKEKLVNSLPEEFNKIRLKFQLPIGDFPNVDEFAETLKVVDWAKFPKLNEKLLADMDRVLSVDIPELMKTFPIEAEAIRNGAQQAAGNPFANQTPFASSATGVYWVIDEADKAKFEDQFFALGPVNGRLKGDQVKAALMESKLPNPDLMQIWALADIDKDAHLDKEEFAIAMYLCQAKILGEALPPRLPPTLVPPTKKHLIK